MSTSMTVCSTQFSYTVYSYTVQLYSPVYTVQLSACEEHVMLILYYCIVVRREREPTHYSTVVQYQHHMWTRADLSSSTV